MSHVPSWHPEAPESPRTGRGSDRTGRAVNALQARAADPGRRILGVALMVAGVAVMPAGMVLVARGVGA